MARLVNWLFAPLGHWKVATLPPLKLQVIWKSVNPKVVRHHICYDLRSGCRMTIFGVGFFDLMVFRPLFTALYAVYIGRQFLVSIRCLGILIVVDVGISYCVIINIFELIKSDCGSFCPQSYTATSSHITLFTRPLCEVSLLEVNVVGTSNETWIIVSFKGCVSYRGSAQGTRSIVADPDATPFVSGMRPGGRRAKQ